MIRNIILFLFPVFFSYSLFAQPNYATIDVEKKYKEAKELFINEQYGLAYPLLRDLKQLYAENQQSNFSYLYDDVSYFYTACELQLKQPVGATNAENFINSTNNEVRAQQLSYHLAHYYFGLSDFEKAIRYYERAGLDNITNVRLADAKFERAYSYFNLQDFKKAKPLFEEITQLTDNKYYIPAHYYYGFLAYKDAELSKALTSFRLVESVEEYAGVVPYYIAEIFYLQGKKDEALRYGESIMQKGNNLVYSKEMNLLLGQLYFEKKNFKKALPLLERYVSGSSKVDKEVMYELSYCYYEANNMPKAIEGFKQLSSVKDSMGQNSTYLLGDCYLRTNQKENARTAFQYCAYNNSNATQQKVSRFLYAKLSYELGFNDIALLEMKNYLKDYPNSEYDTEGKEILVTVLANTSNFREGLELYNTYSNPTAAMKKAYPKILAGRAIELYNDQRLTEANEMFTKLLADANASANSKTVAHFYKGEIAYRNNQYDEAIRSYTNFMQGNYSNGEANTANAKYNLGYSWIKKEQYKNALTNFEGITKSIAATSTNVEQDAFMRSADCYFMLRDYAKANSMYDAAINSASVLSDYAMFQKAVIAGIKNSSEKIKLLNTLTRQYPKSYLVPEVNMEIANTYMADEKFKEAIPFLNNVLADNKALNLYPQAYFKMGLCHYNAENNKAALASYEALLAKYPSSPEAEDAIDNIKTIYVEDGRPNEYVDFMARIGKSISTSEADSLSYTAAMLKYSSANCSGAADAFNNYIAKFPNGAHILDIQYLNAECYLASKKYNEALVGYNYLSTRGANKYFDEATFECAQINFFELKNYSAARTYFEALYKNTNSQENKLNALRGLVRCNYQLKDFAQANESAKLLLQQKGISTDDKAIANLVLGKSQQLALDYGGAITAYKACAAVNKAVWGAEARYEIANCYYALANYTAAEKAAMDVIKQTGSYDLYVTKSYILLGDIFMQQKDYFNAKATYESVAKNAVIVELKNEAQAKLDKAIEAEKVTSKIN